MHLVIKRCGKMKCPICGEEMIGGVDSTDWCGFCDIRFGLRAILTIKELKRKADMIDKGKKLFGFIIIKQKEVK